LSAPGASLGNAAPDDDPVFVATVEGGETQDFLTLQNAMTWMEDFEKPTGTISFLGHALVLYSKGSVSSANYGGE
jgi:hypothetical protein